MYNTTPLLRYFIKKVAGCWLNKKKTPAQVFPSELYKIFENIYFKELLKLATKNSQ